jgi:hypothetical protein
VERTAGSPGRRRVGGCALGRCCSRSCPSSTGRFAACSSCSCFAVAAIGRRSWRSSFFGTSCTCSGVRSLAHESGQPIAPCWRRSAGCCREGASSRCSSSRRQFCGGIANSSVAAGSIPGGCRPAAAGGSDAAACPAPRDGESDLGIQADPRRTRRARDPAVAEQRLEHSPPPRHRARHQDVRA